MPRRLPRILGYVYKGDRPVIRRTSRERWAELRIVLPYFDGRCEAQPFDDWNLSEARVANGDARCRREVVAVRDGFAVCWKHAQGYLFVDSAAQAFRSR